MKVFYVVLLVLVAGAVPSHGRTESEGTVFNKTQLHESMSNVTVSSSKWVGYRYTYLALQWPVSYCSNFETNLDGACIRPVPGHFTVHGLWPHGFSGGYIDCRFVPGSYRRFHYPTLARGINVTILGQYWPDLEGYNQLFWKRQYNKHGSCTLHNRNNNQIGYFSRTLALAQRRIYQMSPRPRQPRFGTFVGGIHSPNDIMNAVQSFTNERPSLKCIRVGNQDLLLEIRFCVAGWRNCPLYVSDCGGSVFIPGRL